MWNWLPDEGIARVGADRFLGGFPSSIFSLPQYTRGIQRLEIWLLGASFSVGDQEAGFRIARWAGVFAFCSASIPTWILARKAGATPPWAALAGLLCVLGPWLVLSGTFLTEPLAFPAAAWLTLAVFVTIDRGGLPSYLILGAAVLVSLLARTGLAVLAFSFLPALAVVTAREWVGSRSCKSLRRQLAPHWPLALFLLGAVAVIGLLGLNDLSVRVRGEWYSNTGIRFSGANEASEFFVGRIGSGMLFAPLIVAAAYGLKELVLPRSRQALILVAILGTFLLAMILTLLTSAPEERYIIYAVPAIAAITGVAATSRRLPAWLVILSAVVVGYLTLGIAWESERGPYGFLLFPAETFHARVIRLGLLSRLGLGVGEVWATIGSLLLGALLALALSADLRFSPRLRVRLAVCAGMLLLVAGAVQAVYSLRGYEKSGGAGVLLRDRVWIDSIARGRPVSAWQIVRGPGQDAFQPVLWETSYFNRDLRYTAFPSWQTPLPSSLADRRVSVGDSGHLIGFPRADFVLTRQGQLWSSIRGRLVAQSAASNLYLVQTEKPASLSWIVRGTRGDGWLPPGEKAVIRVFPRANERCFRLRVTGSFAGRSVVRIVGAGQRVTRRLGVSEAVEVTLPVLGAVDGEARFVIRGSGIPAELEPGATGVVNIAPAGLSSCESTWSPTPVLP